MKQKNRLVRWSLIWVIALFAVPASGQDEAKLFERECASCHKLPLLLQRNWDAKRWQETISRMHQYGATIPQKDIERLANYLAGAARGKGQRAVAYVADEDLNEVLVIDVASEKLLSRIPVGKAPHGIAITPRRLKSLCSQHGHPRRFGD